MLRLSQPPALNGGAPTRSQPEVGSCSVPRALVDNPAWPTEDRTGSYVVRSRRSDSDDHQMGPSRPQAVGINQAQKVTRSTASYRSSTAQAVGCTCRPSASWRISAAG